MTVCLCESGLFLASDFALTEFDRLRNAALYAVLLKTGALSARREHPPRGPWRDALAR